MERKIFDEDHKLFRDQFREFCAREVVPHIDRWKSSAWWTERHG